MSLKSDLAEDSLAKTFHEYFESQNNEIQRNYQFDPFVDTLQDDYSKKKMEQSKQDWVKGCKINDTTSSIALKEWREPKQAVQHLIHQLQPAISHQKEKIKTTLEEIEALSSRLPSDPEKRVDAMLQIEGREYAFPTLTECLVFFASNDQAQYRKRLPFLSSGEIIELHQKIGEYLIQSTSLQHHQRALSLATQAQRQMKSEKVEKWKNTLGLLGEEIHKKREFDPGQWPSFLVFEHYANFSLKKGQCENLQKMLTMNPDHTYPNTILQMIMAAGKTFVLGTLLALEKADGYHLSILVTPSALYETNVQDMKGRKDIEMIFEWMLQIGLLEKPDFVIQIPSILMIKKDDNFFARTFRSFLKCLNILLEKNPTNEELKNEILNKLSNLNKMNVLINILSEEKEDSINIGIFKEKIIVPTIVSYLNKLVLTCNWKEDCCDWDMTFWLAKLARINKSEFEFFFEQYVKKLSKDEAKEFLTIICTANKELAAKLET